MLQRVQRTLRRRERLLHVREMLQQQSEQALAVVLNEEEGLKQQRTSLENAEGRSRAEMLTQLGHGQSVPGAMMAPYAQRLKALCELAQQKERDIEAMQPRIMQHRQEVLMRHKAKRAMEILTSKAQDAVGAEHLRLEQREMDDRTTHRYMVKSPRGYGRQV